MTDPSELARRGLAGDVLSLTNAEIRAVFEAYLSLLERAEGMRTLMAEYLAAKDAAAIFIIERDPKKVGEAAWQAEHRTLSERMRQANEDVRAALSGQAGGSSGANTKTTEERDGN